MAGFDFKRAVEGCGRRCEQAMQREAEAVTAGDFLVAAEAAETAELMSAMAFRFARSIPTGDHWHG